jgi:formate-dependent nitrite reductase cytochrome c552 subunit
MNTSTLPVPAPVPAVPAKAKAKAKAPAKAPKTLPTEVAKAITDRVKILGAADTAQEKAIDLMVASNIMPEMFVAPKKGEDRAFYDSLKVAVIAGFPPIAQNLLIADISTLVKTEHAGETAHEKLKPTTGNRKYWQQQIGSRINDFKVSLQNRLAKKNDPEGSVKKKTTLEERIIRDIKKYVDDVKKAEKFRGDAVKMIASLNACLQYVNE